MIEKNPIGIMPRKIWDDRRFGDLTAAINRYLTAGLPVPQEWWDEYYELGGQL